MKTSTTLSIRQLIAYQDADYFCGWPANHGIWSWGDEILVSFERAPYQDRQQGHSYQPGCTSEVIFVRSLDGGETWNVDGDARWTLGIPARPGDLLEGAIPRSGAIDFAHPDFAMKLFGSKFILSYDRGRNWQGPYTLPDFGKDLTSRTDYLVEEDGSCLLFLSATDPVVQAGGKHRAFCVHATKGGESFEMRGLMADKPVTELSIMASTVRGLENQLLSALRRRRDVQVEDGITTDCWIDFYESFDDGYNWNFLNKIVDLGSGGNPPSLIRLQDGRLCVTYGYRRELCGIRARLSRDDGRNWSEEIVLRGDGRTWDLGYPRTVQRSDGKVVAIYYYTTAETPVQHIAVSIWDPSQIG